MASCNVFWWCMLNCALQSWLNQFNKHVCIFYFNSGDKWVDWSCRGRMGKWSTCYHRRDSHLKSYPNLLLCIPVSGGGHKREVLPMPWRQRKPPRSGINPLTQNLLELDRLISYIQASVILQYRLKHIDKDFNTIKNKKK